ncbi:MAG: 4,5-DOPA-extradiol-dioxygenase [Coriobacteriia bacterium]
MPAAFLGHGNPMNALEDNRFTRAWSRFGATCGAPRAVLMVSAHWFTNATALTAMPRPRTIHDFYGFPRELEEFQYPAPGSVELAEEIAELVMPERIGLDSESWGLDHGTWSVLAHAFPSADAPVVQLSINALKPFDYHMELAARLAPLRREGVVIVGSGNLVHNLRRVDWAKPEEGFEWARRFDATACDVMFTAPGDLARLQRDSDYPMAAPTPDHFIPLLYIAGLAAASGRKPELLVDGFAYGSISMAAYALDMPADEGRTEDVTGASMPLTDPGNIPADQTNM